MNMIKRDFDEMVSYFMDKVLDMDIEQKYRMELLGMVTAMQMEHHALMSWFPVTKALPDTNNDVLLQFPSNMGVGYYENGYWCIVTGEDLYCGLDDGEKKPIAWMPLPEPYGGE